MVYLRVGLNALVSHQTLIIMYIQKFLISALFIGVFCSVVTLPRLRGQAYADIYLGLHPYLLNDGGISVHGSFSMGRQASRTLGYGVNVSAMSIVMVSTTSSFVMTGLQYRLLDRNHRFFGKLELGALLNADYTTDGPFIYDYDPSFTPYYRLWAGHRFGRFTMGMNFTAISNFRESIREFDEPSRTYIATGDFRKRSEFDLQLYLGVSLDAYPVNRGR